MSRKLAFPLALVIALFTVPVQTGCGSDDSTGPSCAKAGESCMTKGCCPRSDGSVSMDRTFSYPGGVQTMTSCTCR